MLADLAAFPIISPAIRVWAEPVPIAVGKMMPAKMNHASRWTAMVVSGTRSSNTLRFTVNGPKKSRDAATPMPKENSSLLNHQSLSDLHFPPAPPNGIGFTIGS
jgi:hypothetical protein